MARVLGYRGGGQGAARLGRSSAVLTKVGPDGFGTYVRVIASDAGGHDTTVETSADVSVESAR